MTRTTLIKGATIAGACAAVGAGAGILGSAGAAGTSASPAGAHRGAARGAAAHGALRRAVHAEAVVPVGGGKFATVTLDRGVVRSVQGNSITLNEGTRKATYRTVTLTLPGGTLVRENRRAAQISDIRPGQMVIVVQGPKRTRVNARG
jgi:hypothetical protein